MNVVGVAAAVVDAITAFIATVDVVVVVVVVKLGVGRSDPFLTSHASRTIL